VTRHSSDAADEALKVFVGRIAFAVALDGGLLMNLVTQYSDRSFELRHNDRRVSFVAKVSLTDAGIWGVQYPKWDEMESQSGEHLVLLRSDDAGYFISNRRLPFVKKKLSKGRDGYRINEGKIRNERRFRTPDELLDLFFE
jgi:hypothetical protein